MGREANKSHGYPGEEDQADLEASSAEGPSGEGGTGAPVSQGTDPSDEAIRQAAYQAYLRRNGGPGDERSDWLEAEAEMRRKSAA
ncbi:DUF2934 domain-containing protein [Variovorax sp. GB1R11]|uniref:DUF2934 domain-containing protein n=1 Tax=Variovorax sp. GB1R11 TaxID=3443741 RepID=UPI003F48591B